MTDPILTRLAKSLTQLHDEMQRFQRAVNTGQTPTKKQQNVAPETKREPKEQSSPKTESKPLAEQPHSRMPHIPRYPRSRPLPPQKETTQASDTVATTQLGNAKAANWASMGIPRRPMTHSGAPGVHKPGVRRGAKRRGSSRS